MCACRQQSNRLEQHAGHWYVRHRVEYVAAVYDVGASTSKPDGSVTAGPYRLLCCQSVGSIACCCMALAGLNRGACVVACICEPPIWHCVRYRFLRMHSYFEAMILRPHVVDHLYHTSAVIGRADCFFVQRSIVFGLASAIYCLNVQWKPPINILSCHIAASMHIGPSCHP